MMKIIALAIAMIAVSVEAADAEESKQLCTSFCQREWSDQADSCNEVCAAAATGELSDCSADASASKEEKWGFWSACSFGGALGKGSSCAEFCQRLSFEHTFAKFFELGCKKVCGAAVAHHKEAHPIECRAHLCSTLRIEMCWRGCNYAAGFVEGTEHECTDC
jgi:hypothetical protein